MILLPVFVVVRSRGLYDTAWEIAGVFATQLGAERYAARQITEGEIGDWNEDDQGWRYSIQRHEVQRTRIEIIPA